MIIPDLPDGLVARPPTSDDLDAVVAVLRADEVHSSGEAQTSTADVTGDWRRPSFELALDGIIAHQPDGAVVGYAEHLNGRARVAVDPDVLGRGIGSVLLAWSEARAQELGQPRIGQTLPEGSQGSRLLQARGYAHRWDTWIFSLPLADRPAARPLPDGITIRPIVRPDEERTVHEVVDTAFDEWGEGEDGSTFEGWRASYRARDDGDDDLVLVAVDVDGQIVGVLLGLVEGTEGWVDQVAGATPPPGSSARPSPRAGRPSATRCRAPSRGRRPARTAVRRGS